MLPYRGFASNWLLITVAYKTQFCVPHLYSIQMPIMAQAKILDPWLRGNTTNCIDILYGPHFLDW